MDVTGSVRRTRRFRTWLTKCLIYRLKNCCWIALPLLLSLFFFPVLFQGYVLSQSDVLYFFPPWDASRPALLIHPSNSLLSDLSLQFYPFTAYTRSSLSHGVIPLWNPALLGGVPFLANMQSAVFYPTTLLALWLPVAQALSLGAWLRLSVGGVATYQFVRSLGLSYWAALLGGMVFMLCAFNIVWLNHPHTNVAILLPVVLSGVEGALTEKRGACAVLMLATSLVLLGGHPETAFHVFGAAAGYGVIRFGQHWYQTGKPVWRPVWWAGSGYGWGLLGASIVLIPFGEIFFQSGISTFRTRLPQDVFFLPVSALWTCIVPDIFGHPTAGEVGGPLNYNDRTAYIGLAPLLLAVAVVPHIRSNPHVQRFGLLAAGALLLALGCPPMADLMSRLPLLRSMPHQRLLMVYEFGMAVLAACGLEQLLRETHTRYVSCCLVLASGLLLVLGLALSPVSTGFFLSLSETARSGLLRALLFTTIFLGWIGFARVNLISRRVCALGLCGITGVDLFVFGFGYTPLVAQEVLLTHTPPAVRYLQHQPGVFRIAGVGERGILIPDTGMLYGLMDVRGYEPMVPGRTLRFFEQALQGEVDIGGSFFILPQQELTPQSLNFLSLMNVRYVLSRHKQTAPQLKKIYDADLKIYHNQAALPRAFIVYQVRMVDTGEDALTLLLQGHLDLKHEVVLEAEHWKPHMRGQGSPGLPEQSAPHTAQIVHYSPHQVDIEAQLAQPGILVLSDTYFPGWKAIVDGQETPIYRANYILRAVPLGPGRHHISFVYDPCSFQLGLGLSGLAWGSLFGVGGWRIIARHKIVTPAASPADKAR